MFDSIIKSSPEGHLENTYVKSRLQIKLELFFYEKTDAKLHLVIMGNNL